MNAQQRQQIINAISSAFTANYGLDPSKITIAPIETPQINVWFDLENKEYITIRNLLELCEKFPFKMDDIYITAKHHSNGMDYIRIDIYLLP